MFSGWQEESWWEVEEAFAKRQHRLVELPGDDGNGNGEILARRGFSWQVPEWRSDEKETRYMDRGTAMVRIERVYTRIADYSINGFHSNYSG